MTRLQFWRTVDSAILAVFVAESVLLAGLLFGPLHCLGGEIPETTRPCAHVRRCAG